MTANIPLRDLVPASRALPVHLRLAMLKGGSSSSLQRGAKPVMALKVIY